MQSITIHKKGEVMNRPFAATASSPTDTPREDWLRAGILARFLATFAMSVVLVGAYWLAEAVGVQDGNALQRWSYALVNNPVADRTAESVVLAIGVNIVKNQQCSDGMSDRVYPDKVQVTVDGRRFEGCGGL